MRVSAKIKKRRNISLFAVYVLFVVVTLPVFLATQNQKQSDPTDARAQAVRPTQVQTAMVLPEQSVKGASTAALATASSSATPHTKVIITLALHGIGGVGDSVASESALVKPLHTERPVTITLTNTKLVLVKKIQTNVVYSPLSGYFKTTLDLGTDFASGSYTMQVKLDRYVSGKTPVRAFIAAGQVNSFAKETLLAGDTNNDGALTIHDYNLVLNCSLDNGQTKSCSDANRKNADINDDGIVNAADTTLMLHELSARTSQ